MLTPPDRVDEARAALDELADDFGMKVFLLGLMQAKASAHLGKLLSKGSSDFGGNPHVLHRAMQFILREIVFSPDPKLEAEIMAIGAGVLDEKGIVRAVAKRRGVTPAAISKRVIAFCDEWKLPPSAAMKSEEARATYAERNQPRIF